MKFIINVSFFDIIEGYSAKKTIPLIFDNIEKATLAKSIIESHNKTVIFIYKDEVMRKFYNIDGIDSLPFDPEKEDWFVSAMESIEYDLISLKGDESYEKLVDGYKEEYLEFKNNSKYNYMSRSLSYLKIDDKVIIAEWSDFSNILKDIEIIKIEDKEAILLSERIEDLNYNNIFSAETTMPMYTSILVNS